MRRTAGAAEQMRNAVRGEAEDRQLQFIVPFFFGVNVPCFYFTAKIDTFPENDSRL
jgi:hypothetical protein